MNLEITFLIFLFIPTVHSKKGCSTSFCGTKSLPIRYPFQLQGQNQKGCDYLALNLTCSNIQDVPLLNLPDFGDFYIKNINYSAKTIQLHDTNDCLPSRFMNAKFSNSPLVALNYQNYIFFTCARGNLSSSFTAISCLSNSTFSVLATSSISRAQELNSLGCSITETIDIPVLYPLQFEYNGFNDDLVLTWNATTCEACLKNEGRVAGYIVLTVFITLLSPFVSLIGFCILGVLMLYFIRLIKKAIKAIPFLVNRLAACLKKAIQAILFLVNRLAACLVPRQAQTAPQVRPTTQPSHVTARSTTNSAINKLNTILVGESRRIPGPNSADCPICLEEFKPKETIKIITECGHCFHESCIDQWLRTHNSCPVCRNAAS